MKVKRGTAIHDLSCSQGNGSFLSFEIYLIYISELHHVDTELEKLNS